MSHSIGPYSIVREIGRGGMGVVYEGWDERLSRAVAIKTIIRATDSQARDRFLREARTAAAVSHPHVCQLFDIGEHEGAPFLCMELLEGRSLAERLEQGPMTVPEAASTALAILSALGALHRRGIVHRDLKPTNVFLTADGIKVLDFGLARTTGLDADETALTLPGVVMGSPRYMAPEQVRGGSVDGRTDLFAAGLVLFEMLSGHAAFTGTDAVDVLHAVVHDHPAPLMGSPAVTELDRIIQRAVAKHPQDRYQTAEDMAADLRVCLSRSGAGEIVHARAARRLVVLPFRALRPDPEVDFLAYSLPDAITVSLSAIESLTVRSTLAAVRFGEGVPDLRQLASELGVDAAISGTLLHAGGVVRVALQLLEVPSGTVRWSHAAQVPLDDLFTIQDSVCSAVVSALALPLSPREEQGLRHDVPAVPEAYELYLRANRLATTAAGWPAARDLYRRAVALDPTYAPAWARLGRVLRTVGKYGIADDPAAHLVLAEEAFQRAFALHPDLPIAHNLYTYMEVESGRAGKAVSRLLGRLRTRTNDADLCAGLVHACRYVGLLDASVAAYHRATRLDPNMSTSVAHTFFMQGQYGRAIDSDHDPVPYISMLSHLALGQPAEARGLLEVSRPAAGATSHLRLMSEIMELALARRPAEGDALLHSIHQLPVFADPEASYYWAHPAVLFGNIDFGLQFLEQAVDGGLTCPRGLETSPILDPLRGCAAFADLLARAHRAHDRAAEAFDRADGHRLLGVPRP